jgi:RNA polymerase sigma-70 factor (ECF subfamily)
MDSPESIEAAFLAYRCTREPAALARVYDGASARLLSVAMHLTSSPATAEDVVQDTFLIALENPERWDETKPLLPWLLGILGNRVRQVAGLARRAIDPARLLVPDPSDPEAESEASELLTRVDEAITHLAQPYRLVVLLRLRNGLSPADISIALGRSPNTVRTQLARGIEMLRKVLPTSVAVLLAHALTASSGLGSARQVVLKRAVEVQQQMLAQVRAALWRKCGLAVAGVGAVLLALLPWLRGSDTPVPVQVVELPDVEQAASEADEPQVVGSTAIDYAVVDAGTERELVEALGSLVVTVQANDAAVPFASVEIEPLGVSQVVVVHHSAGRRGQWFDLASTRPCERNLLRYGVTDADGTCAFADLAPGRWICRSLAVAQVVKVSPGDPVVLTLTAAPQTTVVHGLVLGPDSRPVPQAQVWQCREHVTPTCEPIAVSDADGRFTVTVAPFTTLGAWCPGFSPVAMTFDHRNWRWEREVVLRFSELGASLTGRVLDAAGEARPGVLVEVGHSTDKEVLLAPAEPQVVARPCQTMTDVDGRFRFDSLVPGETVVRARATQHGVAQLALGLRPGADTQCELILPAEVVLTGCVRDANGEPVPLAWVKVGARNAFGHCSTMTDAEGRYRLAGITPGRATVEVSDLKGSYACHDLECAAGDQPTWDAVVSPDNLTIQGQVLGARGEPFPGAWIVRFGRTKYEVYPAEPDGRFSVPVPEPEGGAPAELHFYDHDPRDARGRLSGTARAVLLGVRGGPQLHQVLVPDESAQSGLRGRVVLESGRPVEGRVTLVGTLGGRPFAADIDDRRPDGSFAVASLEAGTYWLRVEAARRRLFGPIEVGAATVHDAGVIRLPGEAATPRRQYRRFALLFPDSACGSEAIDLEILDPNGWVVDRWRQRAGTDVAAPFAYLPPGTFTLRAVSASGLVAGCELVVDPDRPPRRAVLLAFRRP